MEPKSQDERQKGQKKNVEKISEKLVTGVNKKIAEV